MNQRTFIENCKIYQFPPKEINYKTPGLKEYMQDIHNYMSYMAPIIDKGH